MVNVDLLNPSLNLYRTEIELNVDLIIVLESKWNGVWTGNTHDQWAMNHDV